MKHPGPIINFCMLVFVCLAGCKKFEYSPYQTEPVGGGMPENLNVINIAKLHAAEELGDDTVTILYSGDSQRFYDELHHLVAKTNELKQVDFFILCGDLSDFGLLQEYQWVYDELKYLKVPYLCAIGNHDLTANGEAVFIKMFGQKNFSFKYRGYKFLFHDTNGREYNFNGSVPDLGWMSAELNDQSPSWFVAVSHVPPYDGDFDHELEMPYKDLLANRGNVILSLHGHLHNTSDAYYYGDNVRYMTSNAVEKREAILLKFIHGQIIKQMISY